jgi:hypothetical protein
MLKWDSDILMLQGVVIGEVVEVLVVDMAATLGTSKKGGEPRKCVKLMHILPETLSSGLRSGAIPFVLAPAKNKESIENTSWCPWWINIGDIVIVVPGVSLPLVVSKVPKSNDWWLLGCCRLIDSTLETEESHVIVVEPDPGYSPIMYGSAGWAILNSSCTHFEFDRINYTLENTSSPNYNLMFPLGYSPQHCTSVRWAAG